MMPRISTFKPPSMRVVLDRFLSSFSDEKLLSDRLFWMAFYVCVGLLPPLISIIGHKAVYLPLLVISTLVIARFFIRWDCRKRIITRLTSPGVLMLLSFALLVMVHALAGTAVDFDRSRILAKPVTILLATILLAFIWSHRDIIKVELLFSMVFIGVFAGLLITILKIMVMKIFFGVGYHWEPDTLIAKIMHIHDTINDELKILAVFVFLAVLAIKASRKRYAVLMGLLAAIMVASFNAIGYNAKLGSIVQDYNDTTQFGIVVALLVLLLAYIAPRLITNLFFGALAFVFATAPWLFQLWYKFIEIIPLPRAQLFLVRGELWDAASKTVLKSPFFGFGIDSARYLKHIDIPQKYFTKANMHHPHNMVVQLWLDLGLVGVSIFLGFVYLGWRFISQIEPSERPPILAGLTMLAVFAMVTSSMWQTWIMAMITFFLVLVSLRPSLQT